MRVHFQPVGNHPANPGATTIPHFHSDTPRKPQKLFELAITAPHPFAGGHVLSADEAGFINSQVSARVANSYAGKLRKATSDAEAEWEKGGKKGKKPTLEATIASIDADAHQSGFDALYADYTLRESVRGTGEEAKTPLERMIDFLAGERAKANIIAKGHSVAKFQKTKTADGAQSMFKALVVKVKAAYLDDLTAQAEAQLAAASETGDEADELFDGLELPDEADEAEAA